MPADDQPAVTERGREAGGGARRGIPGDELRRRSGYHEFFLALRRGFVLGRCRTCETFYLMAKLCLEEGGEFLAPPERADAAGWVEGGSLVDLDFGCDVACAVIPLYTRVAQ